MAETAISSFIVRFVQETDDDSADITSSDSARWRGIIRHVQSNEEAAFVQIEQALAFIDRFVPLQTEEKRR
jgi:hypothetical protein